MSYYNSKIILKNLSAEEREGLVDIKYEEDNDKLVVKFNEALIPYFKAIRKDIKADELLKDIVEFKGKYSLLVYNLCKMSLNNAKEITEELIIVDDLRSKLGIDEKEYKKYNDFKRKVLLKAQSEINDKSDIYFDIEEETSSRKVKGIKFIIKNSNKDKESEQVSNPNVS